MIDFREKAQMFYARCRQIPQPPESLPKRKVIDWREYEEPSYMRINARTVEAAMFKTMGQK